MLHTSGFFSNVICPFFDSGLCERPYCHFKHSKPVSVPNYVPTPLYRTNINTKPVSVPKRKAKSTTKKSNVPEYKPTPISELKKLQELNQSKSEILLESSDEEVKSVPKSKPEKTVKFEDDVQKSRKRKSSEIDEGFQSPTNSTPDIETVVGNESPTKNNTKRDANVLRKDGDNVKQHESDLHSVPTKKTRIAHKLSDSLATSVATAPKKNKLSAAQVMINRLTAVTLPSEPVEKASATVAAGKKRIAHNLKPMATYSKNLTASSVKSPAKGNAIEEIKRPTLPLELGAKVPLIVRQRYLNIFLDECLKCTPDSKKTAYDRGLEEEKNVFKRSSNKNIYMNLAANRIKAIRSEYCKNEPQAQSSENNGKQTQRMISHESVLNGPQAVGCSIQRRQVSLTVNDIDSSMLYSILQRFLLSKEDLKKYGFPVLNSDNKEVTYSIPENKIKNNFMSSRRTCCRCHTVFQVNEAGIPIKKEECVFHQGRLWKERYNGAIERKYSCCKGDATSGGCCCASSHVIDGYGHADLMKGYISTLPANDDSFPGVYALDCEMCYTTIGLELTRISVIDHHRKCVYESLVKPKNMILDYNTKFSGIQETDLVGVTVTLEDVQTKLKTFINNKTILIGHSLDSDFKALKLIHETVVDTSAVFPHKNGLPQRRALRTITAEFLKKIIQDEVGGHDSQEDAMSCMELMLYKVGQELSKMKKVT